MKIDYFRCKNFYNFPTLRSWKAGRFERTFSFRNIHPIVTRPSLVSRAPPHRTPPRFSKSLWYKIFWFWPYYHPASTFRYFFIFKNQFSFLTRNFKIDRFFAEISEKRQTLFKIEKVIHKIWDLIFKIYNFSHIQKSNYGNLKSASWKIVVQMYHTNFLQVRQFKILNSLIFLKLLNFNWNLVFTCYK